jgi:hypothetical protein
MNRAGGGHDMQMLNHPINVVDHDLDEVSDYINIHSSTLISLQLQIDLRYGIVETLQ